ncbi:MAG TPA: hypothetical protein VLA40_10085 [Rheinheimera sp.]|nr:hypothetical protein [Rheinheimera sp.]
MAAKSTVQIKPDQRQLRGLYQAFKEMDVDSKTKLKNDVTLISAWSVGELKAGAFGSPMQEQSLRVADTIRANKDRIPNVTIGGSKSRFSGGAVSGEVLFGNEFGASPASANGAFPNGGRRFPFRSPSKGRGNEGYWIFKTLTGIQPEVTRRWKQSVTEVLNNWNKGAGGGIG